MLPFRWHSDNAVYHLFDVLIFFLPLHQILPPWCLSDGWTMGVDALCDKVGVAVVGGMLGKYVPEFLGGGFVAPVAVVASGREVFLAEMGWRREQKFWVRFHAPGLLLPVL